MSDLYSRDNRPHLRGRNGAVRYASDEISNLTRPPSCPRCSAPMRLSRLEPHPTGEADDMLYECGCGEGLIKTVERR